MDDRAALLGLNKRQLIEIILLQREAITRLEGMVEQLTARVAQLEAERAHPPAPSKTPDNSSLPPSTGFKPNRPERRSRRRRASHDGISRHRHEPDVIVRCHPETCQGCGEPLPRTGQRRVGRSQVIELPPIRPVVIEAWQYAARCSGCGTRTKGSYPDGLESTRTFGPGIESLLAYFHERHHISYERLVELCRDAFGLSISEGGIDMCLARLAGLARPTYEALGAAVRASPVIGSDETGARVAGRTAWRRLSESPDASYHTIEPRRNADVVAAFLGETRPAHWVSDLWAPQVKARAEHHQLCLAHQIRNVTYAAEADGYAGVVWAVELRHLFGRAVHLGRIRDTIPACSFTLRRRRIENAVDRLVFRTHLPEDTGTTNARRLQQRYRQHRARLFVFLDHPEVPPTNNASEQDLRPSVIHRKVTGGYRSWRGADCSAIFTSLLATARKRGHNLLDTFRAVAGPSPLCATSLAT